MGLRVYLKEGTPVNSAMELANKTSLGEGQITAERMVYRLDGGIEVTPDPKGYYFSVHSVLTMLAFEREWKGLVTEVSMNLGTSHAQSNLLGKYSGASVTIDGPVTVEKMYYGYNFYAPSFSILRDWLQVLGVKTELYGVDLDPL